MRALCNREGLLTAFNMVSGVVPARSPKPILQNVKLVVDDEEGSVLMGTDLEVGIRHRVLGVKVEEAGSAILPTQKIGPILRTSGDEELLLETTDEHLLVKGARSSFKLPLEDPTLYPEVPDFGAESYHVIVARDLKKLIRRTMFATDLESARYALGGVLVELKPDGIAMIGTDGRRLAKMSAPAQAENDPPSPSGTPVIPVKALKLIERNLVDDDLLVHLSLQSATVLVRTEGAVIYARLVEGRFPDYKAVLPKKDDVKARIPLHAGAFASAIRQAAIMIDDETRRLCLKFGPGLLTLSARNSSSGRSKVELPLEYSGSVIETFYNPVYLLDMLKQFPPDTAMEIDLVSGAHPAMMRAGDDYQYLIMPLT